jgi:Glyoxalase-like domain
MTKAIFCAKEKFHVRAKMRGLDHVVHLVKDLEKAGEAYAALGFIVGQRNKHPWGTHNKIIQFNGFFIEILEVAEPHLITQPKEGEFSFGAFNAKQNQEGLTMLVLEGTSQDHADYEKLGLGGYNNFSFSREGEKGKVGFDLCFAKFNFQDNRPYAVPNLGFFTCKQHAPENFWDKAKQNPHTLDEAVFVSENPYDYADFFGRFIGERKMQATSLGIVIETPRGRVRLIDPLNFETMFGEKPAQNDPLSFAALVFKGGKTFSTTLHNTLIMSR